MRPNHGLRWLGSGLLVLGAAMLVAAITQYGFMFERQVQLRSEWSRAAATAAAPRRSAAPPVSPADVSGPIRIVIPKIGLDDMVARGTDYAALLAGPGWMPGTAAPGMPGNVVIAGHRDTFFRHVHELQPGDWVLLRRAGHEFRYQVTTRRILKPSDTAVLNRTRDAELTLVTCYPTYWVGPAPDRLIVQARLVPQPAAPAPRLQAER